MIFNFIILLILFRKLFFYSLSYDIRDGYEQTIKAPVTSAEYNFYIRSNNAKFIIFNAKTTKGCQFYSFKVYEYDSIPKNYQPGNTVSIAGKMINDICEYYLIYNILSHQTYVDFQTTITDYSNNKTNITIRMDLIFQEYYLSNGNPLEIYNLYIGNSYFLYLEFFEAVDISFIINNNITWHPFYNIIIHEFEGNPTNSKRINYVDNPIQFKVKNNQTIATLSYSTKSNITKYIAFQIKPKFSNISHLIVNYEYPIISIDLNDGIWKTIDNLIANKIYLLYIEATDNTKINISLMINNTGKGFDEYELQNNLKDGTNQIYPTKNSISNYLNINVYSYKNKSDSYLRYSQKNTEILHKKGDIYFMNTNPFLVDCIFTTYVALAFKLDYNVSHMLAKIDTSGGTYNLFNNTSKNMTKLKSDGDYYFFFLDAKEFNFVRFTLTINNYMNLTTNPFPYIYSKEKTSIKVSNNSPVLPTNN